MLPATPPPPVFEDALLSACNALACSAISYISDSFFKSQLESPPLGTIQSFFSVSSNFFFFCSFCYNAYPMNCYWLLLAPCTPSPKLEVTGRKELLMLCVLMTLHGLLLSEPQFSHLWTRLTVSNLDNTGRALRIEWLSLDLSQWTLENVEGMNERSLGGQKKKAREHLLSTFNVEGRHWNQNLTFIISFKSLNNPLRKRLSLASFYRKLRLQQLRALMKDAYLAGAGIHSRSMWNESFGDKGVRANYLYLIIKQF